MLKIGDKVRVINKGATFDTYEKWIERFASKYFHRFKRGYTPSNGDVGNICVIGEHENPGYGKIYLVDKGENIFLINEEGIEKIMEEKFVAKSGMIAVMSDGKERLIVDFLGGLIIAGKNDWLPYSNAFDAGREKTILEVRQPLSNAAMNYFLDGKTYEFVVVWTAESPEKKKLREVVDRLQAELNDAQEKLNNL